MVKYLGYHWDIHLTAYISGDTSQVISNVIRMHILGTMKDFIPHLLNDLTIQSSCWDHFLWLFLLLAHLKSRAATVAKNTVKGFSPAKFSPGFLQSLQQSSYCFGCTSAGHWERKRGHVNFISVLQVYSSLHLTYLVTEFETDERLLT